MKNYIYHLGNGTINVPIQRGTKVSCKHQEKFYNNERRLINDCLREVKKRNHVVTCYNVEQLTAILEQSTVELEFDSLDGCIRIWRKK